MAPMVEKEEIIAIIERSKMFIFFETLWCSMCLIVKNNYIPRTLNGNDIKQRSHDESKSIWSEKSGVV